MNTAEKKTNRWKKVARNAARFIGGEIEHVVNRTVLRGPIQKITIEAEYLTFFPLWIASSPDQPEPDWTLAPNGPSKFRFWLPSDKLSVPYREGRRIRFTDGPVRVTIYPKNDGSKLEPTRVKGL